jgi:organic radical activating enzyme
MFGTNEIIGKKFFKDAPAGALFVTSMFITLQGEGPYAGRPAFFIRLAKCNLACSFCDTFFDDGDWMSFEEINLKATKIIRDYYSSVETGLPAWVDTDGYNKIGTFPNIVLVVTGGEPLLQKNLMDYLNYSKNNFGAMQIESNGTVDQDVPEHVTLVCSPKCAEKGGIATKYLAPTELILKRADCLKFVMSSNQDSPYSSIPDWAHNWKYTQSRNQDAEIYISPMNIYNTFPQKIKILHAENGKISMDQRSTVDEKINFFEPGLLNMEQIAKNHEYVGQYCMKYGFRMNMQMHLFANLA